MNKEVNTIIKNLVNTLVQKYHPEKIILFGSYAYGNPAKESDIDILIIKKTDLPFLKRLFNVRRLVSSIRYGYPFEPLVLTPEELNERLNVGDDFFKEIVERGKVLYTR